MKNHRYLGSVAALAALVASVGAHAADKPVIGLVQANQQALYFVQLGQGAQAEANKRGFKLVVFDANNDPAAQNNAMETYTEQKVVGIVIDALDRNAVMPDVRASATAGIYVSAVDTILPDGPQIAQVGVDSVAAGAIMGKFFVQYVAANGGKAKVGVVGALNSSSQNERQKGFEDVVKAAPGIAMAGVVDGRNIQENAMSAAENLITANPDLTAIYATGEPALIGAAAAVESQGKQTRSQDFRMGLVGLRDQRNRCRIRSGRHPTRSRRHGGRGRRRDRRRGSRRQGAVKDGHDQRSSRHRHQGQRRSIPGSLQMNSTGPDRSSVIDLASRRSGPIVSIRGITKRFGSVAALRGVDLDLFAGECLGIIGDNAAGKSTLTKVLAGTYVPDAGSILLNGEAIKFAVPADARARHIEMVYQDLSLCDTIDIPGNMFLGRELTRGFLLDRASMERETRRMLDELGIRIPNLALTVAQLSGGQRQSIAIARAVAFDPKVLIMDEPTSALAVTEVEAVLSLINRVKSMGVSVILITHQLQDLFRVCDRIAVMYEGTKVAERSIGQTGVEELVQLIVGKAYAP